MNPWENNYARRFWRWIGKMISLSFCMVIIFSALWFISTVWLEDEQNDRRRWAGQALKFHSPGTPLPNIELPMTEEEMIVDQFWFCLIVGSFLTVIAYSEINKY